MSTHKLSVFQPIANFFTSGLLIVFKPDVFFENYTFIFGRKRDALLYSVLYILLSNFIMMLATQAGIPYLAAVPYEVSTIELFVFGPIGLFIHVVVLAVIILAVSAIAKSGFNFKSSFNLVCSLTPYSFFFSITFAVFVILFPFAQLTVLAFTSVIGFVFLMLTVRTFNEGAIASIQHKLVHDATALHRFYWTLVIITLLLGLIFIAMMFAVVHFLGYL